MKNARKFELMNKRAGPSCRKIEQARVKNIGAQPNPNYCRGRAPEPPMGRHPWCSRSPKCERALTFTIPYVHWRNKIVKIAENSKKWNYSM